MADDQGDPRSGLADPPSGSEPPANKRYRSDESRVDRSDDGYPRIVEEHHMVGPRREDEVEATDDRGRRWYDVRPEPRGRADFIGVNCTWWLVLIVVVIVAFLPW